MAGKVPVCSPKRENITSSLGKRGCCAKALAKGAPSRKAALDKVSAAACKAFKMGTPAMASMAKVLAKRAAL
jgi:hypothetical protein